jgi:DNA-binding PadR family transcriptional regulator
MLCAFRLACSTDMARVNPAELPASMAVLGIVIEQPNETVGQIGQCLDRRFTRARFARSTAHNTLPRLAGAKHVRRTHQAPGGGRSKDRYEATPSGIELFRSWMTDLPAAIPALRDAMYGRIELARLEDLPRLIEMARREEALSGDLYAQAAVRLRQHTLARQREPPDLLSQVREVLLYADPMHWASRSERYKVIADRLEEIAHDIAQQRGGVASG